MKIVSLVPSLTEFIADVKGVEHLTGRTRFCIHPDEISQIPIVGGTKNPNIEKILHLKPDLIVANKEENRKKDIEELKKHTEVHLTNISTVGEALNQLHELGLIIDAQQNTETLLSEIKMRWEKLSTIARGSVLYLIWYNPWMGAGNDTYIHDILTHIGFTNFLNDQARYPEINPLNSSNDQPDYIFLSSEPFPFKKKHAEELQNCYPESSIRFVDGEWFSWYGSRMASSFKHIHSLITNLNT